MKKYTKEELLESNGEAGKPALVAVDTKVYDVSGSKKWINGTHMRRHKAGVDLTTDLKSAPHGPEVLERVTLVGSLETEAPQEFTGIRGKVEHFLNAFPFFRRHPHPAVVHIPIGFFMVIPLFQIAALITGSAYTEWAAFLCVVVATITIPAAIVTGYFTWWINYEAKESHTIILKRKLAWLAFGIGLALLYLRIYEVSNPVVIKNGAVIVYTSLILVMTVVVASIGFLGGKLTFPYDH